MHTSDRISGVFASSKQVLFGDDSKFILMSDCHRGDGSWADDFSKNQNLYQAALTYYYNENYTYIEIGDGDELWKNKNMKDVFANHSDAFWLLSQFYEEKRLYFIYGNHDMAKKNRRFAENEYSYYDEREKKRVIPFKNIEFNEGLVLCHENSGCNILLLHGHQADFFNYSLWRLGRFLVRRLWKKLELIGIRDPTSTARNYKKKDMIEEQLSRWAGENGKILIAGHTHRPVFPEPGQSLYFNDGSCVHPRCITGIEIESGRISLVKWSVKTGNGGSLYVGRDVLAGPEKLGLYFKKN